MSDSSSPATAATRFVHPSGGAAVAGLSRREVLRLIALTASAGAAMAATGELTRALAQAPERAPIRWLNDGGEDLNLLAQLGRRHPGLLELVSQQWDLVQWDALSSVGFALPAGVPAAAPIVILESYPPRGAPPRPAHAAVQEAVEQAKAVILLGTDACFGGLRHSAEDVKELETLCRRVKTPLIKLPGIPVPVQHLVGTLAHLQFSGFPRLDSQLRPELYYSTVICTHCERRADLEAGRYAAGWGERGCLLRLGCKGPITHNTCSQVRWNGGENWCVGAGGPCTGCAEPGFPDHGGLGLYGRVPGDALAPRSPWLMFGDWLGKALLATTAAGVGLHAVRRWWGPPPHAPRRPGEDGP